MIDFIRGMVATVALAAIMLSLMACVSSDTASPTDTLPAVAIGTSKADVVTRLGQPDEKQTSVKQQEYIWGPPEEWWHTLEIGDSIEAWSYEFPQGILQLYFIRGSETVDYVAFVDKDIVY